MKKDLAYYKANAKEDYKEGACLSVLRYISELESELESVKADLEKVRDESYQSAIREAGTSEQLKNMTKAWRLAQSERDELRNFVKAVAGGIFTEETAEQLALELLSKHNRPDEG